MKGLRKVVPPKREILADIWLSFLPGAKIGVVGPNGSGKSSLLRVMAGVDADFQGKRGQHGGPKSPICHRSQNSTQSSTSGRMSRKELVEPGISWIGSMR